jgi:protein-L-isoaspartate(D-aspartate) O-methyltransferase
MDTYLENKNMIDGQVKPLSNIEPSILEALYNIDRKDYIPENFKDFSYSEKNIYLGNGRYLPKPAITAKLLSALEVETLETVLIIGSTTGYSAAITSKIAETVICIEEDKDLISFSESIANSNSINNIVFINNKLSKGYIDQGPYSCILIEGGIEEVPNIILDQIAEGGKLVTVIMKNDAGSAIKYIRKNNQIISQFLFSIEAPSLKSFEKAKKFKF